MKKKLINHVALVIDDSPSMAGILSKTRQVVNEQIRSFKATGKRNGQETRISVFVFGGTSKIVCFDMPPERVPDAVTFLYAGIGGTAVMNATWNAIKEMAKIPTQSGDHSFLVYVITDGEDNASHTLPSELKGLIEGLNDDWTVAAMVPNLAGKHHAKNCGFPADNIEVWATTEKGIEEATTKIGTSYQAYSAARSLGIKSTKSLFKFENVSKRDVVRKLDEVSPGDYETLIVRKYDDKKEIKDFVETWTKRPYRVGSAYYQLTKPEKIQPSKTLAVIEKATGKMFSGANARELLGLPNYEVKVEPASFKTFDVFVQSTSTNRHVVADTHLVVFK